MIEFEVPGKPFGKQRARTGKGFAYTPKETVNYENLVKLMYMQTKGEMIDEKPVWMEIEAYYDIPKSYTKGKKQAARHNIIRPTKKPDMDNIAKIILDALNSLAYKDDSQVVNLSLQKFYTESEPKVVVKVGVCGVEGNS